MWAIKKHKIYREIVAMGEHDAMVQKVAELNSGNEFLQYPNTERDTYFLIDLGPEYNGWTNRETWLMNLWLTNDWQLYKFIENIIKSIDEMKGKALYYPVTTSSYVLKIENMLRVHADRVTRTGICIDLYDEDLPYGFDEDLMLSRYFASDGNKIVWTEVLDSLRESILGEEVSKDE